jgi:undecaprenyl-diphosphatase
MTSNGSEGTSVAGTDGGSAGLEPRGRAVVDGQAGWSSLRRPPVTRRGLAIWLLSYVAIAAVAIVVGLLIVHALGGVRHFDDRVAFWFRDHRTRVWNAVTWVGSGSAEAVVKIPATLVLSIIFVWRWRRWTEPAMLAGALVFEVCVFATASFVVGRDRPPVPKLDAVPPTSSFPSGHAAAAVAFYGALAIIVFWHTRNRVARGVTLIAAVALPLVVGASRMYRGMHHLSDVVVGFAIGAVALLVTSLVVRDGSRAAAAASDAADDSATGVAGAGAGDRAGGLARRPTTRSPQSSPQTVGNARVGAGPAGGETPLAG